MTKLIPPKLIFIAFLAFTISLTAYDLVSASSVARSFSSSNLNIGQQLTVTLTETITAGESYYTIDETIPAGLTITSAGSGNTSQAGHIKWAVIQNASSTLYSYTATANTAGTYNFAGTYMFEGTASETAIGGSAVVAFAAVDTTAPSAVSNLSASNITQTSLDLAWTAPGDDGSVGTASSYDIRYSASAITSANWSSATQLTGEPSPLVAGSSQSYAVVGLSPNTAYYFAVRTTDDAGNISNISNVVAITTQAFTLSVSLSASPSSGNAPLSVSLTAQVGGTISGNANYTFYCNRSDSGTDITLPYGAKYDNVSQSTYTATGVCSYSTAGTYTAKVIVEKNPYQAESRISITVSPSSDIIPPTISSIATSSISANSALVSWQTNETADSQVEYGLTTNYGSQTALDPQMILSHSQTLSGLSPSTLYHFRIKSKDGSNNSSVSSDGTLRTSEFVDAVSPSTPGALSVQAISTSEILVSWGVSTDNVGLAGYRIFRNNTQIATSTANSLSYKDTSLASATAYTYTVSAFDAAGNVSSLTASGSATTNSESVPVSVSPPASSGGGGGGGGGGGWSGSGGFVDDVVSPSQPREFKASSYDKQIILAWQNPTDSDFVRVLILKKEGAAPVSRTDGVAVYESTGQGFTDAKLDNAKTYYYAIYSYDRKPNYSQPVIISARPEAARAAIISQPSISSQPTPITGYALRITGPFKFGAQSEQAKILQQMLASDKAIYPEGKVTGYYGGLTAKAVQRFQCRHNIICSGTPETTGYGIAGPKTRNKLNEVYKGTAAPMAPTTPAAPISSQTDQFLLQSLQEQVKALQDKLIQLLSESAKSSQ